MVSGPSFPNVNESPICKTGKMPGVIRQRQYTSHMGSSLRVLGGPFNLEQDLCQWLELKETESSCQITGNVKCQACWQDPSQLGWSSRQVSRSSRGNQVPGWNEMKPITQATLSSYTQQAKTGWRDSCSPQGSRASGHRANSRLHWYLFRSHVWCDQNWHKVSLNRGCRLNTQQCSWIELQKGGSL